jgi:hypothetical protein
MRDHYVAATHSKVLTTTMSPVPGAGNILCAMAVYWLAKGGHARLSRGAVPQRVPRLCLFGAPRPSPFHTSTIGIQQFS